MLLLGEGFSRNAIAIAGGGLSKNIPMLLLGEGFQRNAIFAQFEGAKASKVRRLSENSNSENKTGRDELLCSIFFSYILRKDLVRRCALQLLDRFILKEGFEGRWGRGPAQVVAQLGFL